MSAIEGSTGAPLPFDNRGDPTWQVLAALPLLGVVAAFLVAFVLVPGPPNLSMIASSADAGPLHVTEVMTGGIAWDMGIRAGQEIVEFKGGEYQPGPPEVLRDPVSARVLDTTSGRETEIDARGHALAQGVALPALWILATLFASLGGAVGWTRAWDVTGRRLFLLFGFLAVFLALGSFSGTKGGMLPVVLVGFALSGAGYALVSLFSVFPYAPPLHDWRRKYLIPAFGILLVPVWAAVAGRLLTPSGDWWYALARAALGLYMGGAALAALAELAWSLRQNTSRGRRAQVAILIVTFALGLGPLVFGALLPRLLFLIESSLSLNLAMFSLLFIPVGVAYAVVRYQSSHFYRQTENLLVPGTIGLAVFIFLFLTLGYLAGDVQGNRLLGTVIPALVAAAGAAVASIGSATFGGDKGSLETVESRRRQALLPLYNRLVQARAIAPMLIGTRQEHTTQLRPTLDALIPKLHAALGLPDIPVGEERDVISSLKSLVDEVESLVSYPIIFDCTRSDRRAEVSPEVSHVLYAISQQALSNVVLHSRASEVTISLEFQQDHVLLHIRDNGVGFAATAWEKLPDYPGLQKAAQHVRRIGGELRLYASPGRGTWIIAKAPYNSSL